ncbi:MAG: hypothetical protein U9R48_08210 [Chloroflexota bacterium]|nr:hypothetical protein [Chloroflexota bacterium]
MSRIAGSHNSGDEIVGSLWAVTVSFGTASAGQVMSSFTFYYYERAGGGCAA